MKKTLACTLGILLGAAGSIPATGAFAQGVPVFDATALANQKTQFTQQIAQLVKEYEQALQLYNSINGLTNMDDVVGLLNDPDVREILGPDVQRVASAFDVSLDELGALSETARDVYDFASLDGVDTTADGFYRSELDRIKRQSGRSAATGERIIALSDDRLEGLEGLRQKIGSVSTQKEMDALNARIAVEQAMLQNDAVRVQGMAMLQEAQIRAEEQRQAEVAAERREKDKAAFAATFGDASF